MNATRLRADVLEALADLAPVDYTANFISVAISNAMRAMARYAPDTREYGEGRVQATAAQGAVAVATVGGPFAVGDVVTIGAGLPTAETKTVSAVTDDASETVGTLGHTSSLTVTALANAHSPGELVRRSTMGLTVVPSQELYRLPRDFISVDQTSLDLALGVRADVKRETAYYDALYTITDQRTSVRYGSSLNFGPVYRSGYPVVGDPAYNPNQGIFGRPSMIWRFRTGDRPDLSILPAPTGNGTIRFYYNAAPIPETIPDSLAVWVLRLVIAEAAEQTAHDLSTGGVWSEADVAEDPSRSVKGLLELAQHHRKLWDAEFKRRPVVVGG